MNGSRFLGIAILAATASVACRRDGRRPRSSDESGRSGTRRAVLPWFPGAAPLLLAPGRSPDRPLIALIDTAETDPVGSLLDSTGTFLRLDGGRAPGRVAIAESAEGCIEASLNPSPPGPWGVGFIGKAPPSFSADSIRGMTSHDSSSLASMVSRLADDMPADSGGRFAGRPYSIVDLWRFHLTNGRLVVVAMLRRQINQEDSPLQERTFLVAEADSIAPSAFTKKYGERSMGAEENVESRELLGIVAFSPTVTDLVVARDFGDETAYSIIERSQSGEWSVRWTSRRFSC